MKQTITITILLLSAVLASTITTATAAPTAANPGDVVITEIMYNPASSEGNTETQYVELFNTTGSAIDLSAWTLDDEDADGPNTIPAGTSIPAGGFVVIVGSSLTDFENAWGIGAPTVVSLADDMQTMINLSNSPSIGGEVIELRDETNTLIDTVDYDDASPWPADNDASSIYLNVTVDATANDDGANWALSTAGSGEAITASAAGAWDSGADIGSPGGGYTPTAVTLSSAATANDTGLGWLVTAGVLLALSGAAVVQRRRTV